MTKEIKKVGDSKQITVSKQDKRAIYLLVLLSFIYGVFLPGILYRILIATSKAEKVTVVVMFTLGVMLTILLDWYVVNSKNKRMQMLLALPCFVFTVISLLLLWIFIQGILFTLNGYRLTSHTIDAICVFFV
ncbi:hypothetical protein QNI19_33180 [Cytophagaceae bacterium DM2B3-1]|uniref:Uncharacterized protein n=1 Tax=Xanthocytophaga flava TaxID=3048013 RepID=A0ABT7CWF1_9BACT|nr:hypothetical protein [Xanthocytophaga flavus]